MVDETWCRDYLFIRIVVFSTDKSSNNLLHSRLFAPSMSRTSDCLESVPMKLFFSRLKVALIYAEFFESIAAAKFAIYEYIEVLCAQAIPLWAILARWNMSADEHKRASTFRGSAQYKI